MPRASRAARAFAMALFPAIVLAALLFWASGTEPALRWLAGQIVEQTQGKLALEGVRGSLHGPLSIDRLVYEDAERRVEMSNLKLDWSPSGLLRRTLRVSSIHADSISVSTKERTDVPAKLPDNLDFPLAYELGATTIGRLTITNAAARTEFSDLVMRARYGGDTHAVTLERLGTPGGEATAQLALGDRRPFPIKGEVTFNAAARDLAANATLSGSLTELRLKASARAKALTANAALTATPFEPAPLKSFELDARGLDPSAWRKNLPKADIHVNVIADADSGQPMRGHARAENAIPGALDSGRVPFRTVSSDIATDFSQLTLSEIRLDLEEAALLRGTAAWKTVYSSSPWSPGT